MSNLERFILHGAGMKPGVHQTFPVGNGDVNVKSSPARVSALTSGAKKLPPGVDRSNFDDYPAVEAWTVNQPSGNNNDTRLV